MEGEWHPPLPKVFLIFFIEGKASAPDVFSSGLFIPRAHFESSRAVMVLGHLTRYKQKVVLAAMLEGKSMPSNMAANTNPTTFLKNQIAKNISLKCVSSKISDVR